jgi:thymidylate synthase (FAD)
MTQSIKIVWATPDIDKQIAYMARVSNPDNQSNQEIAGILRYMMREGHTSPFEMANICVEINTTRDIGRQILRHRSFSFQEFSQRYQDVSVLGEFVHREPRLQDKKNRQNSTLLNIEDNDSDRFIAYQWEQLQTNIMDKALQSYQHAIGMGIAKEQARALLPEGLTMSRLYMNGNMRSWIFYLKQRLDPSTQREHRDIACMILQDLRLVAPITMKAFFDDVSNND